MTELTTSQEMRPNLPIESQLVWNYYWNAGLLNDPNPFDALVQRFKSKSLKIHTPRIMAANIISDPVVKSQLDQTIDRFKIKTTNPFNVSTSTGTEMTITDITLEDGRRAMKLGDARTAQTIGTLQPAILSGIYETQTGFTIVPYIHFADNKPSELQLLILSPTQFKAMQARIPQQKGENNPFILPADQVIVKKAIHFGAKKPAEAVWHALFGTGQNTALSAEAQLVAHNSQLSVKMSRVFYA